MQFLVEGSSSLDVFVDDERFARVESPFTLVLDTTSLTEGAHRLEGRAQNVTSDTRTITVDRTPPRITRRAPLDVEAPALRVPIEVEYDEPLAPESVRPDTARLLGPAGAVEASLMLSADSRRLTLGYGGARPLTRLALTVAIEGVTDLAGNVASADQWVLELLPFQRIALPDGRFPERLVVDATGRPWVVSATSVMTQVVEVWRDGRWHEAREGVPPAARITDLHVTPEGTLELVALEGTQLLLLTRAPEATAWQLSARGPMQVSSARLTSRSDQPAVVETAQGVRLVSLANGGMTVSAPVQLQGRLQVVRSDGPVTVASFEGTTLSLYRVLGQGWEWSTLPLRGFSHPQVLRGRDDRTFRLVAVDTMTSQLAVFDVWAGFGTPGVASSADAWSTATLAGEAVEEAAFPAMSRDSIDTGDLGGRGFVVSRNNAMVSVWPFGWETYRQVFFSEQTPVTRVPAGEYSAILADSRWFTNGTAVVHRHGVIVQRQLGLRLRNELYLPND